ncbi:hypothetical protein K502DRAFT_349680 [Neoconidiobolus thromboides FSU 785]|nr:hypothetical protein K502DRAFT_349680 [Neoconidiobolus thromboides FSU 785]
MNTDAGEDSQYIQEKAQSLVRLALITSEKGIPMKREDIKKYENPRDFKPIIERAQLISESIFGMKLIELESKETMAKNLIISKKKSTRKNDITKPKSSENYILVNNLTLEEREGLPYCPISMDERIKDGQTVLLLCLIFVYKNCISHGTLARNMFSFREFTVKELDDLITRLMRQNYIIRQKVIISEENAQAQPSRISTQEEYLKRNFEYHWGPRAKAEVTFESLKSIIKEIYGDDIPAKFDIQFEKLFNLI